MELAFDLWRRVDVVLSFSDWVMVAGWQLLSRPPWFVAFVKSPPLLRLPSNSAKQAARIIIFAATAAANSNSSSSLIMMIIIFLPQMTIPVQGHKWMLCSKQHSREKTSRGTKIRKQLSILVSGPKKNWKASIFCFWFKFFSIWMWICKSLRDRLDAWKVSFDTGMACRSNCASLEARWKKEAAVNNRWHCRVFSHKRTLRYVT